MNKNRISEKLKAIRGYYESFGKQYDIYIEIKTEDGAFYKVLYSDLKNLQDEQGFYIDEYTCIHYYEIKDMQPYSVPRQ